MTMTFLISLELCQGPDTVNSVLLLTPAMKTRWQRPRWWIALMFAEGHNPSDLCSGWTHKATGFAVRTCNGLVISPGFLLWYLSTPEVEMEQINSIHSPLRSVTKPETWMEAHCATGKHPHFSPKNISPPPLCSLLTRTHKIDGLAQESLLWGNQPCFYQ